MLITCPRCQTKFMLADELLPAGGEPVKLKCSRCGQVFPCSCSPAGEEVPASLEAPPEETAPAAAESGEEAAAEHPREPAGEGEEAVAAAVAAATDDRESPSAAAGAATDFFASDGSGGDEETAEAAATGGELPVADESGDEGSEKEATGGEDDPVFELADDFGDDELSWDDLDELDEEEDEKEMPVSPAATIVAERQTTLDDQGLTPVAGGEETREEAVPEAVPAGDATGEETSAGSPALSRRKLVYAALILLVFSLALWSGVLLWEKFTIDMGKHLQIVGLESQSYIFSPERRVIAIQGRIHNSSPRDVGQLQIKGILADAAGKPLVEKVTAGGVVFSAAELRSLDEKSLAALENRASVVKGNGGELPFMIVFYNYPPAVSTFHVELADFVVLKKGRR